MLYLTDVNLNGNEIQNAILHPSATAPSNPKLGQLYCDTVTSKIKWYTGSRWQTVGVIVESSAANGSIKVDGLDMTVYTLPKATANILGGMRVGSGLTVNAEGVVSVATVTNLTTESNDPLAASMGKSLNDSLTSLDSAVMKKSVYDNDNDGVVDNSERFGGQLPSYYAKASDIPTELSAFTNDENFIDNTVTNLLNYYTKAETFTKSEVNTLVGNLATIHVLIPEGGVLPSSGSSNNIYLIPKNPISGTDNTYDEYLWVEASSRFEKVGDTTIDLANYLTKTGESSDTTVSFTQAGTRANIATGESLSIILGKIAKYLNDLSTVAFSGSSNDLVGSIKYDTLTQLSTQSTATKTLIGSKILATQVVDSVTKDMVLCDIDIDGMTVTLSTTSNPTNNLIATILYV